MRKYDMQTLRNKVTDYVKNKVSELNDFQRKKEIIFVQPPNDPRSESYIKSKTKILEELGLNTITITEDFSGEYDEDLFIGLYENVLYPCSKDNIPYLIQLPYRDISLRSPMFSKASYGSLDIDGLTRYHVEKTSLGDSYRSDFIIPCTVQGIKHIITDYLGKPIGDEWNRNYLYGITVLVIGRGELVGSPLARLLMDSGATLILANAGTSNLKDLVNVSDIIVSAVGKHGTISEDMINDSDKPKFIIDAGVDFIDGKLHGDFKYNKETMEDKLPNVVFTPHIGGVGPMTVLAVAENVTKILKGDEY